VQFGDAVVAEELKVRSSRKYAAANARSGDFPAEDRNHAAHAGRSLPHLDRFPNLYGEVRDMEEFDHRGAQTRSRIMAMPCPTPMHIVQSAYLPPVRRN